MTIHNDDETFSNCKDLIRDNRPDRLRDILIENRQLISDQRHSQELMRTAAICGRHECAAVLMNLGIEVNIPYSPYPDILSHLTNAVRSENFETVRWFVENGALVNFSEGKGYRGSYSLCNAAIEGRIDILIFLLGAGADVNSHDSRFNTALDFAIAKGDAQIVAELRRRGGVTGTDLPDYVPPPTVPAVLRAVDEMAPVYIDPRAWPDPAGHTIAIRVGLGDGLAILFTQGLSDIPLKTPDGMDAFRHAELVAYINGDTVVNDYGNLSDELQSSSSSWVADWLFKIAEQAIGGGEWFGDDFGIISNGDKPDPLTAGTDMTTWLLLPVKPPFERFQTDNGDDALFYTLYPIHTSERDFVRKEGLIPLLRLFEQNYVYNEIKLDREPVV